MNDNVQTSIETQNVKAEYSGFMRRFGAALIDSFVVSLISWVLMLIAMIILALIVKNEEVANSIGTVLMIVCYTTYYAYFESRHQSTPGKMASGIKVTNEDGSRISLLKGYGRYFARWISTIPMFIGYIMALFTERKQALHDMICGTVVVNYRRSRFWPFFLLSLIIPFLLIGVMMAASVPLMFMAFSDKNNWHSVPDEIKTEQLEATDAKPSIQIPEVRDTGLVGKVQTSTLEGYQKIFEQYKVAATEPGSVSAGPLALQINEHSMGDDLSLLVKTRHLMRFDMSKRITIRIDSVLDETGKNIYNPEYFKEKGNFAIGVDSCFNCSMHDENADKSIKTYERAIDLIDGYDESDVKSISGIARITLPAEHIYYNIDVSNVGQIITMGDKEIKFVKVDDNDADFELKNVAMNGINFNTIVDELEYYGVVTGWSDGILSDGLNVDVEFKKAPRNIGVIVDQKSMDMDFPFTLTK